MKFIVALLLVLNVLLLSWWTGWLNLWDNREPERLRKQVDAERITVQGMAGAPPLARNGSDSATAGAAAQATPASPGTTVTDATATGNATGTATGTDKSTAVAATVAGSGASPANGAPSATTAPAAPKACLEFPPMDADKAQAVEASMKQAGLTVDSSTVESTTSFIVLLPPSESTKEAQRKLAELKRLGITDAFLMQDGPFKLGISLGLFRSEEGAKALVQQLVTKGVRSARIAPSGAARVSRTVLKATGSEAQLTRVRQAANEVSLSLKSCDN